jgi:predicted ATP-grasp superfamily ATP-dependent carboligase
MTRILLTGARAPVTLDLARAFHAAGHTVFVADSLPWPLCRGSKAVAGRFLLPSPNRHPAQFIDTLAGLIQQHHLDWLIPTCEEIYFVAMGRDTLRRHCAVFTDALTTLHQLHSKWAFIEQARQLGLPVPPTARLTSPEETRAQLGQAVVLKPVYSRFSAQVVICPRRADELPAAVSPQRPWVVQQFVPGRLLCTYSLAHAGRLTAHAAYPVDFTAGRGAAIAFTPIGHPAALDWVRRFVAGLNFTGQIAFDFIETTPGHVVAIECNPRATSGVHLLAHCPTLPHAFFDPAAPLLEPPPDSPAMLTAAMLLYGLPAVRSMARLRQWAATFRASREVVFHGDDPLPGLVSQWALLAHMLARSLRHGLTPLAASTLDIEWNGEVPPPLKGIDP